MKKPKPKKKIGRPTVLTPAIEGKIAQCFFDGFTDEETAIFCGISRRTIIRARQSDAGFCHQIRKAELAMRAECLATIRASRANWCGVAWFLERRWPTIYSRPETQLQINNVIGPQVQNVVILAPAQARKLDSRSQTLEAEVEHLVEGKNGDSK